MNASSFEGDTGKTCRSCGHSQYGVEPPGSTVCEVCRLAWPGRWRAINQQKRGSLMQMSEEEVYAGLSGIHVPEDLLTARNEARGRVLTVRDKITELADRRVSLQDEIRELVCLEAASLVDKGDDGKLAKKRQKAEDSFRGLGLLLAELAVTEAQAKFEQEKTEAALESHINDALVTGRGVMKFQLGSAMERRGRQLGSLRAGEVLRSTPPEKSSQSRIAVCEYCGRDLAIIREDARQPVTAACFEKLQHFDNVPFHPQAELKYFKCPYCQRIPWGEENLILTNMGYRIIPEQQKEE